MGRTAFELKPREERLIKATPPRMRYLIRRFFANGSPANDEVAGMKEGLNRAETGRHGEDVAGIQRQLDYLNYMGFTAIGANPFWKTTRPDGRTTATPPRIITRWTAGLEAMKNTKRLWTRHCSKT